MTREEAVNWLKYSIKGVNYICPKEVYEMAIKALEQPERKKGKWIEDDIGWDGVLWRCSECAGLLYLPKQNEYHFCPFCGADMRGEQE